MQIEIDEKHEQTTIELYAKWTIIITGHATCTNGFELILYIHPIYV